MEQWLVSQHLAPVGFGFRVLEFKTLNSAAPFLISALNPFVDLPLPGHQGPDVITCVAVCWEEAGSDIRSLSSTIRMSTPVLSACRNAALRATRRNIRPPPAGSISLTSTAEHMPRTSRLLFQVECGY